jgi:thioredoxin reductase (NADPH)
MYGADAVDAYVSTFVPLEWTVMHKPPEITCIAKVIVDKTRDEKVVGMHIAAPNAGEIIQGFAVAFRKGLVYKVCYLPWRRNFR